MDPLAQLRLHLSCVEPDAQVRVFKHLETAARWHRQNVADGDRRPYDAAVEHLLAALFDAMCDAAEASEAEEDQRRLTLS
jgi:hypothetical protein